MRWDKKLEFVMTSLKAVRNKYLYAVIAILLISNFVLLYNYNQILSEKTSVLRMDSSVPVKFNLLDPAIAELDVNVA